MYSGCLFQCSDLTNHIRIAKLTSEFLFIYFSPGLFEYLPGLLFEREFCELNLTENLKPKLVHLLLWNI